MSPFIEIYISEISTVSWNLCFSWNLYVLLKSSVIIESLAFSWTRDCSWNLIVFFCQISFFLTSLLFLERFIFWNLHVLWFCFLTILVFSWEFWISLKCWFSFEMLTDSWNLDFSLKSPFVLNTSSFCALLSNSNPVHLQTHNPLHPIHVDPQIRFRYTGARASERTKLKRQSKFRGHEKICPSKGISPKLHTDWPQERQTPKGNGITSEGNCPPVNWIHTCRAQGILLRKRQKMCGAMGGSAHMYWTILAIGTHRNFEGTHLRMVLRRDSWSTDFFT